MSRVKPPLALLATALLGLGMTACGGAAATTPPSPLSPTAGTTDEATAGPPTHVGSSSGYLKNDGDKDSDDAERDRASPEGDASIIFAPFGHRASTADARAVTNVVKSYYAASAAQDGAKACSLLTASLALGVGADHAGSVGIARERCAASMSLLLKQQHRQLVADDVATMVVTSVHVKGNLGVAALGFRAMPESELLVEREGHAWKIDALFAGLMP
jgi:hypothetical protein